MRIPFLLAGALALALTACKSTEQASIPDDRPLKIVAAEIFPAGNPNAQALDYMGELLEQESAGRITFERQDGFAFGGEKGSLREVRDGEIAMTRVSAGVLGPISQQLDLLSLPYVFRSREHMRETLDGEVGEELLRGLERGDVVGLGFVDDGARSIFTTVRTVRSPDDLQGIRLRTMQHPVFVGMAEAMGAEGVMLPFKELKPALEAGKVNGAELGPWAYELHGFHRTAPYYSLTEHLMMPGVWIFSKDIWDRLSVEDRDMIRRAARAAIQRQRELWEEREKETMQRLARAGVEIVRFVDKEPFVAATEQLRQGEAAKMGATDLLRRIQAIGDPLSRSTAEARHKRFTEIARF